MEQCTFLTRRRNEAQADSGVRALYQQERGPSRAGEGDDNNHLLVLAQDEEGYRNLVRITSEASLHGSIASRA